MTQQEQTPVSTVAGASLDFQTAAHFTDLGKVLENPAVAYVAKLAKGPSRDVTQALLKRIARFFGGTLQDFAWGSLRHAHLAALRSYVADRYQSNTANRWITAVRGVLRAAWRMGQISTEDLERACDVEKVRGSRLLRGRAVPTDELAKLLHATTADRFRGRAARDAAAIALLYGGGLRRAELVGLDVGDFTPGAPSIRVIGKGNKERTVFLGSDAAEVVARWIHARGSRPGPLLLGTAPSGDLMWRRMHKGAVDRIVKKLAARSGTPSLSPHDLRRTYIGDLLDAGADLVTVQQLAGHADVSTTAKYDRRGDRTRARAAQLLRLPSLTGCA